MKNKFDYGIDIWGDGNFFVEDGVVKVNYKPYPSLISITKDIRKRGFRGPLLLRFPHITKKQIKHYLMLLTQALKSMTTKVALMQFFL